MDNLKKYIDKFNNNLSKYKTMQQYYQGITDMRSKYIKTERASNVVEPNFLKQFISEEISYLLGNKITYISKTSDSNCIEDIKKSLYNWSNNHDKELMKACLTFGEAYELYYIDSNANIKARICTPLNATVVYDEFDEVVAFLYFYKKSFEDTTYVDVYEANTVKRYNADTMQLLNQEAHIFNFVPVSVCKIGEYETIFNDIKGLQDAYSQVLSDLVNEIADHRNAYLIFNNCEIDNEELVKMKKLGALKSVGDSNISWLIKNINDTFVQNVLTTIEKDMLKVVQHVDFTEKLQSNSSSLALRTRLISLENKVKGNSMALIDCLEDRIKAILYYLKIKENKVYNEYDIEPKITLSLPQDDIMISQISSQMGDRISTETILSQLSFIDNPLNELEKIKAERDSQMIDLDNVGGLDE